MDSLHRHEWIGAGDPAFQKKAVGAMNEFLEKASIVVFASHNERLRNKICSKTIHLEKGKTFLVNDFIENGRQYGVYYTYIAPIAEKHQNQ